MIYNIYYWYYSILIRCLMKMGVFFFGENSIRKNHYIFDSLRVECVAPYTSGRDCIINLFKVIGAVFHSESNWMLHSECRSELSLLNLRKEICLVSLPLTHRKHILNNFGPYNMTNMIWPYSQYKNWSYIVLPFGNLIFVTFAFSTPCQNWIWGFNSIEADPNVDSL